jgi:hypothetical protein
MMNLVEKNGALQHDHGQNPVKLKVIMSVMIIKGKKYSKGNLKKPQNEKS